MASKKLQRQLKRAFGVNALDDLVNEARGVLATSTERTPEEQRRLDFLAQLPEFLENIDRSYAENEDRLAMASRNIDISSAELSRAREAVTAMVDSLTEGYMVINPSGVCDGVYSRVSLEIFETAPAGRHLFDLLRLAGEERETAEDWLRLAFADRMGLTELAELGPRVFVNSHGQEFRLGYSLVRDYAGVITGLVVITADITEELEAKRLADAKVEEAKVITKLIEDKESFQSFARLAREVLRGIAETNDVTAAVRDQFRFDLHTLKGGAATFFLHEIEAVIHQVEVELRTQPDVDADTVRAMAKRVDDKLNEMISRHRRLLGTSEDWVDQFTVKKATMYELIGTGLKQGVAENYLELILSATFGVDVGQWLNGFESTVQVAAQRLHKRVRLDVSGESVRVPLGPYRRFFAALVHLFRNAVDHGVEGAEDRENLGKEPEAVIRVTFGGPVEGHAGWWLNVADDGRGMNVEALRQRYVDAGYPGAEAMNEAAILNLLFEKSISTKTEVSETSGMGVGLSALGQELRAIGGSWHVTTSPGRGTSVRFLLPSPEHLVQVKRELGMNESPARPYESELNFRYNELISEIAVMIREARERERVDQEIAMARAVQKTLLPPDSMQYDDFNIAGRSYVAGSCGGDWWYHARNGDILNVWIGDVLGHGIASALVASACRATAGVLHLEEPHARVSDYLSVMNEVIHSMTAGEIYVTGVCMKVNLRTGAVEIGSASHPSTLIVNEAKGGSRPVQTPISSPLGLQPKERFTSTHFQLKPGEGVFLMTDGLLDLNTRPGVRWSLPRILSFMSNALIEARSSEGMISAVESFIFDNGQGELVDDTTYVALYRNEAKEEQKDAPTEVRKVA